MHGPKILHAPVVVICCLLIAHSFHIPLRWWEIVMADLHWLRNVTKARNLVARTTVVVCLRTATYWYHLVTNCLGFPLLLDMLLYPRPPVVLYLIICSSRELPCNFWPPAICLTFRFTQIWKSITILLMLWVLLLMTFIFTISHILLVLIFLYVCSSDKP